MKSYKYKSISFNFPYLWGSYIGFLFLLLFINSNGQVHISENTLVSLGTNTTLYSSEGFTESAQKELTKVNKVAHKVLLSDSLTFIVKTEIKPTKQKTDATVVKHKKPKAESTERIKPDAKTTENEPFTLVYKSFPKSSSDFFSTYGSSRLAVVQHYSKTKEKKQTFLKEIFHFTYNYVSNKNNLSNLSDDSIIPLYNLEKYITRPPPGEHLNSIS